MSHTYPEITAEHAAFYAENGYLIVENALSAAEVAELRAETTTICRGDRGTDIRNYEPPPAGASEAEVLRNYLCIHFPHKISSIMEKHLAHPTIVDVLTKVIGPSIVSGIP